MRMGYCPQMDALDYLLTVKETLEIYAKLRGLSSKILDKVNISENVLKNREQNAFIAFLE